MSNEELGIAKTDSVSATNRLAGKDGLDSQQQWNASILGDRMTGIGIMFSMVLLIVVWTIDLPSAVRYGITILVFLFAAVVVYKILNRILKKINLREAQITEHQAKKQQRSD